MRRWGQGELRASAASVVPRLWDDDEPSTAHCDADDSVILVAATRRWDSESRRLALTILRFTDAQGTELQSFAETVLPDSPSRFGMAPLTRSPTWGAHIVSSKELVLWRDGAVRRRLVYDDVTHSWTARDDLVPTPEETLLDSLRAQPALTPVFVHITPSGTRWLGFGAGTEIFVATDAPITEPCR